VRFHQVHLQVLLAFEKLVAYGAGPCLVHVGDHVLYEVSACFEPLVAFYAGVFSRRIQEIVYPKGFLVAYHVLLEIATVHESPIAFCADEGKLLESRIVLVKSHYRTAPMRLIYRVHRFVCSRLAGIQGPPAAIIAEMLEFYKLFGVQTPSMWGCECCSGLGLFVVAPTPCIGKMCRRVCHLIQRALVQLCSRSAAC
jgi:hypothetical protein